MLKVQLIQPNKFHNHLDSYVLFRIKKIQIITTCLVIICYEFS